MDTILSVVLVALIVAAVQKPVHAYLDPGSGSMFMQLVLGGVAGFVVIVKLYWRQLLEFLRIRFRDDK